MDQQIESSKNEFKKSSYLEQTPSISSDKQQNEILLPQPNSHGFSKGITLLQILPIIYALMLIAQTIILILTLQSSIKITISIIFTVLTLLLIILWFLTTKIDPTDQTQIEHRKALLKKQQFNLPNCKYYCNICQTYVGKQSFHCKKCNRCVQMFDHHCKWLNNCIGAKNYLEFFALICTIQLSLLFNLVFNSVKIGISIYNHQDITWYFYLQISFICVDSVILCFNSVLFVMHLYLIVKKKTTLQLILERRKVNRIYPSLQVNIFKKQTEEHISNIQSNFNQSVNQQKTQKIKIQRNYIKAKAKSEHSPENNTPNLNIYSRKKSKTLIVKMNSIAS